MLGDAEVLCYPDLDFQYGLDSVLGFQQSRSNSQILRVHASPPTIGDLAHCLSRLAQLLSSYSRNDACR